MLGVMFFGDLGFLGCYLILFYFLWVIMVLILIFNRKFWVVIVLGFFKLIMVFRGKGFKVFRNLDNVEFVFWVS